MELIFLLSLSHFFSSKTTPYILEDFIPNYIVIGLKVQEELANKNLSDIQMDILYMDRWTYYRGTDGHRWTDGHMPKIRFLLIKKFSYCVYLTFFSSKTTLYIQGDFIQNYKLIGIMVQEELADKHLSDIQTDIIYMDRWTHAKKNGFY